MKIDLLSLLVAVITTGIFIGVTVCFTFYSISKDLKYLIHKEKEELTYSKSISLTELYIFHLQTIIKLEVECFIEIHFINHLNGRDIKIIEGFINEVTSRTLEVTKHKFSNFVLAGGGNFSDMITELLNDRKSITELTKKETLELFEKCVKGGVCGEDLKARFQVLITRSVYDSKARIIDNLKNRYNVNPA